MPCRLFEDWMELCTACYKKQQKGMGRRKKNKTGKPIPAAAGAPTPSTSRQTTSPPPPAPQPPAPVPAPQPPAPQAPAPSPQPPKEKKKTPAVTPQPSETNKRTKDKPMFDDTFTVDEYWKGLRRGHTPDGRQIIRRDLDEAISIPVLNQTLENINTDVVQNDMPPPATQQALNDMVRTTTIHPSAEHMQQPHLFLSQIRNMVREQHLQPYLENHRGMKWYGVLHVRFVRRGEDGEEVTTEAYFHATARSAFTSDSLEAQLIEMEQEIMAHLEEFQREGSGWSVDVVLALDIFMAKYAPLQGGYTIPTPQFIAKKKATINIVNEDERCFVWAVLAGLYPARNNPSRVANYRFLLDRLDTTCLTYPVEVKQIPTFEGANNISISVFGFENEKEGVFPVKITSQLRPRHVNLLLLSDRNGLTHYITITSMSRLLRKPGESRKKYYCPYCLHGFCSEDGCNKHIKNCRPHGPQRVELPTEEQKTLKFENFKAMMAVPFVIYADLESYVEPIQGCQPNPAKSYTWETHSHKPSGYCYTVVSQDPARTKDAVVYRGPDVMEHLLDALINEVNGIQQQLQDPAPMIFHQEDWIAFRDAKKCFVCDRDLKKDKVRDHDHLTGAYRGAAHQACNLQLQVRRGVGGAGLQVPVIFHNLKGYDANHIMSVIGLYEAKYKVRCIAQNMEKYLSFSLGNLKFIDSLQFMNSSLDKLVKNLANAEGGDQNFQHLNRHFTPEQTKLLRRKGVYPYSYVENEDVLNQKQLPPKEAFYNDLQERHISQEDYDHANNVWNTFEMGNLGDYHDLYLKTDVLLLADVFENFRRICLQTYKLDPAHYISAPGLSWDSMLRTTKVQLELITDPDMHLFLEKGMRGGISMISHRHATANNRYMPGHYDPDFASDYIAYWDANNLYGWSMSKALPHSNFHWLSNEEMRKIDVKQIEEYVEDSDEGYFLEVDMDYPLRLHRHHNDYPLAPEKLKITHKMLSETTRKLGASIYGHESAIPTSTKLVPHLGPRKHYVIHIENLKQCLDLGMQLRAIHRVLAFRQSKWLKPYIDLNTEKRKAATNEFEKDFFKLMNNSVFGKSCENVRNRSNVELVSNDNRMRQLCARPSFKRFKIFNNNLVAVELLKSKVKLNKPLYTGIATLELSKTLMYNFHYNVIKAKYASNARLLFTDTDSLCYAIFTDDLYKDMFQMKQHFDTSNYPKDHFLYSTENAKVLGKMKDELAGVPGEDFVGLRPKMYSILTWGGVQKNTAKGVGRKVIQNELRHDTYRQVLNGGGKIMGQYHCIRGVKHTISTRHISKVALCAYEDKRFVLQDGIDTWAHGHFQAEQVLRSELVRVKGYIRSGDFR